MHDLLFVQAHDLPRLRRQDKNIWTVRGKMNTPDNSRKLSALLSFVAVLAAGACQSSGPTSAGEPPAGTPPMGEPAPPPPPPSASGFVQAAGSSLQVEGGPPIHLRGINLSYDRVSASFCGAGEWREADHTDWGVPVTCWYQEKHFALLRSIGFNAVRLNLSYRIFEDNAAPGQWKQSGWNLLDQLVQWGRDNQLYLILDMHVAPGGAGIVQCLGCGYRTWDEPAYQSRFVALWREIARRYASEPQIAAYDLLNEPVPTSSPSQWQALAQSLIDAVREVDQNHLVIVEMVNWIFDRNDGSPLQDFDTNVLQSFQFVVNDAQTLYDFHYYIPKPYTLQYETGVDGGVYPDASTTEVTIAGASMPRNMAFLRADMATIDSFWKSRGVPINFGEWGTEGDVMKGGATYAGDMLTLMGDEDLNWQFYFMNRLYDISCCFADNPTTVRSQALIDAFRTYFASGN